MLMNRCEIAVGAIRSPAHVSVMNAIASTGGLTAHPGGTPHVFRLVNSGRCADPEVGAELFMFVRDQLDRAVLAGTIPWWSLVEPDRMESASR
jgi:hypothetical protein